MTNWSKLHYVIVIALVNNGYQLISTILTVNIGYILYKISIKVEDHCYFWKLYQRAYRLLYSDHTSNFQPSGDNCRIWQVIDRVNSFLRLAIQ